MTDRVRSREGFLRVQLELPPASAERMMRFKDYMECATYAEAVRNLLKLSDELMDLRKRGHEIVARDPEGRTYPIFNLIKP